jgi:hypothetical protein
MERNQNVFTNLGKSFKKELEAVVQQVMVKNGVKKSSDLADSVEFTDNSRDSLFMYVNDYYQHVSKGRKPKEKKIPIDALIRFIKKNGIVNPNKTTNQLAYAMQTSIYKSGISGKGFLDPVQKAVTDLVELRVADFLEEFVADSLYSAFTVR